MKLQLPKKIYILGYSLIAGVLLTLMPFTVTLERYTDPLFLQRLISSTMLFVLVVFVTYFSLYVNMRYYKASKEKILLVNVITFFVLTVISISIHYPFWSSYTESEIPFFILDEIVRNAIITFVSYFISKFQMKEKENQQAQMALAELEKEKLQNQVRGLTQQLNPHFFFNALNTLSGIVQESPEKSELFIDKLSQVFRYVLKLQDYDTMNIEDELKFMDDYIYLLRIRFDGMMHIEVENHADIKLKVVPLCTQLLIENAIKHNRINRQTPMIISIIIDNQYLTVSNSYHPQSNVVSNKMGLNNLNKRCELYAGKPIVVEKTDDLFTVKVPLMKGEP
jgi:two-component system LytT family sensor kinase